MTKVQQIPFHSSVGFYEAAPPQCIVIRQAITAADGPSPASSWAYPTNDLLSTESSSRSANDLNQGFIYNGNQFAARPRNIDPQCSSLPDLILHTPPISANVPVNAIEPEDKQRLDSELEGDWPHVVHSEYIALPEPVDSEYILEKIDSQYLLSELDMGLAQPF
ncbi:hypothetical protein Tcan_08056 [Toxocara canis]|uniref:Uncharacterized protein n=1 Tax=Toxocara canis TaxID=6265 RepID=A0A0B2VEJ5_TOXCA|nr:hypothetical protein Tcan_08056 [Toxocara canis]